MLWADDTGNEGVLGRAGGRRSRSRSGIPAEVHLGHESWKELYDAYMLLSTINVTREEAVCADPARS